MHLPQAGCCQRGGIEVAVNLLNGLAQLLLHDGRHLFVTKGGHLILQLGQLLDVLGGEEIGAGGEKLPHLNKGRAEVEQRLADPNGSGAAAFSLSLWRGLPPIAPGLLIQPEIEEPGQHKAPDVEKTAPAAVVLSGPPVGGIGLSRLGSLCCACLQALRFRYFCNSERSCATSARRSSRVACKSSTL
jgi:hypothetical protein